MSTNNLMKKRKSTGRVESKDSKLLKISDDEFTIKAKNSNLYDILGIDSAFDHYELEEKYRLRKLDKKFYPGNKVKYLKLIDFAYKILSHENAKKKYDVALQAKINFQTKLKENSRLILELRIKLNKLINSSANLRLLRKNFNALPKLKILRNTKYNRLLVRWAIHPNNDFNENMNVDKIISYFKKYGEIVGGVLCENLNGCAVIEFASHEDMIKVLTTEQMYDVKDYNEYQFQTINPSRIMDIEKKIEQLV
ncbi:J-domain protein [Adoxophyes orana nucleopolyhedrovirus]|uniref:J-domain protein n=1 Tax=Adoxophyes orana nucleopolyhedrovirus TaxID=542343 RepID=UPI0001829BFD|nr:J-domain protein [Adoxophyes orana nucleopolyhedrovirus]ACF05337.1 J-domain protein [Adoxophyes orana nucleopolyhedrovirus]